MIKLLIFDLDGTLVDTLTTIQTAVNTTMKEYGFKQYSYDEMRTIVGHGARKLIRDVCTADNLDKNGGEEFFEKVYSFYSDAYYAVHLDVEKPYNGVLEALTKFKEAGYKLAVLSNKPNEFVEGILNKIFPENFFAHMQGQTELPIKPHPAGALAIAEKFGYTPEECAFIGDAETDVMTGKNAKMKSVAVTWGYRDRDLLESLEPDAIADNASELEKIFLS